MAKINVAKLSQAKINSAKLNHGLNIYYKFFNFIYLFWQVKIYDFILFGIFFRKCKFD